MATKKRYGKRVYFTFENVPHEVSVFPMTGETDVYSIEPRDAIFKEVFPDSHDDFQVFPFAHRGGVNDRQQALNTVVAEAIKKAYDY